MQRFFVKPHQIDETAHQIHITGTDVNHIANVLRMRQGEELWISDGEKKEYHCAIEALGERRFFFTFFTPRSRIMNFPAVSSCSRVFPRETRWN